MLRPTTRRDFLIRTGRLGGLLGTASILGPAHALGGSPTARQDPELNPEKGSTPEESPARSFEISLAQWSQHRTLRAGNLDNLEFAARAKKDFDISAVEYVNSFFKDKAEDREYLGQMKKNAEDAGVRSLLIMVDGEGNLADASDAERLKAIDNHKKWIDAAAFLGCHSIRVNAAGGGDPAEKMKRAAEALSLLADIGKESGISVIVENHGGDSSNGEWLAGVMKLAAHEGVGTLPDFGNFHMGGGEWYDRYKGVEELMPYAKAVSAKSHEFDEEGNETKTDYRRMMKIVLDAGYSGFVGIEYEGSVHTEHEGILATKRLLERVREELA